MELVILQALLVSLYSDKITANQQRVCVDVEIPRVIEVMMRDGKIGTLYASEMQ